MLFTIDVTGVQPADVFEQFWSNHEAEKDLRLFSEQLVNGVHAELEQLDERIAKAANRWRIERMAIVDRNVLRMALYEMELEPRTPAAVVIDEAIEVARRYSNEESVSFVNGVLDAIRRAG